MIISKLIGFFSFSHGTFNGCILTSWNWQVHSSIFGAAASVLTTGALPSFQTVYSSLPPVLICHIAWKSDLLFWYLPLEMPPVVKRSCFTLSFIVSGNISKPSARGLSWP